jgi:hypothetical protein
VVNLSSYCSGNGGGDWHTPETEATKQAEDLVQNFLS